MRSFVTALALLATALLGSAIAHAQQVPPGHRDFYPSPDHPIGWRGDGTGAFPGATPVGAWNTKTGQNIVWKTRMPTPSWSQPLVVGDRVFTLADPNLLICVDVNTGKILWQKAVDNLAALPADEQKKARDEIAFFADLFTTYVDWLRDARKLAALAGPKTEWKEFVAWLGLVADGKGAGDATFGKLLADPKTKAQVEAVAAPVREYGFSGEDPHRGDNYSVINYGPKHGPMPPKVAALNARMTALRDKYDYWAFPWMNWHANTTMTFATPVSDGQFVYVALPQNQTACYDLKGNCKWLVWDHPKEKQDGTFHTRFCASPLLIGDLLIVNQNLEIRAYNKTTGKKIWSIFDPYHVNRSRNAPDRPYRPQPEGCSPAHIRLPLAGKEMDYIADAGGNLYRASDGAIVCKSLPCTGKGQTPVSSGDLYVWETGADGKPYSLGAYRLKAVSADKVECSELWNSEMYKTEGTAVVCNGVVYTGQEAWDLKTGGKLPAVRLGVAWNSPILAGSLIVARGGRSVGPAGKDGKGSENVMEDDVATLDPDWDRHVYCGQCGTFGNSSPFASANRLFFRTAGHLWCVGDPKTPYDWDPASRPKAIADTMK